MYGMTWIKISISVYTLFLLVQCRSVPPPEQTDALSQDAYMNSVHGAWQAIMVANHTGLVHEGIYLDEPASADEIELVLLDQWSTDDDTMVEWVYIDLLEDKGLNPSYEQIREAWMAHLNHDLWVSTLRARELMDEGVLPPETGSADLNPDGVWSIDAQLETELFGLMAPGMPRQAVDRAQYFAKVTNSGLAVDVSAFYAVLYALAFTESDIPTLISEAQTFLGNREPLDEIIDKVTLWHRRFPDDWRQTRRLIRDAYDTDPEWWASKVNFASTIMALLYGDGDLMETLNIASLAGWDADNNATTAAGLLGIIIGYDGLPAPIRDSSDIYFNEDVTGDLPKYDSVKEIAQRTFALGERQIIEGGGEIVAGTYAIQQQP